MRTLLAISIALGVIATSNAEAATATKGTKQTAKTAVAKKAAKKKAVKTEDKKDETTEAPKAEDVTSRVESAPAAQTSTASAAPAVAAVQKRWSGSIFTETYSNIKSTTNNELNQAGGADLASDGYLRLNYKVNPTTSVSALQEYSSMVGLSDNNSKFNIEDTQLRVTKSEIAKLGRTSKLFGQARLYLPTSALSQSAGQLAAVRLYGSIDKKIGNLTLTYTIGPRFYFQRYTTRVNDAGTEVGNSYFRLMNIFDAEYAFNDKWSIATEIAPYQKWYYGETSKGINYRRDDYLYGETFINFNPSSWLSLSLGVITDGDGVRLGDNKGFALYDPAHTSYDLRAIFSL